MSHTPYGYKIENGKAVINEKEAERLKILFQSYLAGHSLESSAQQADIKMLHTGVKRLLQNKRYLGDEFYPAIIDSETFIATEAEHVRRAKKRDHIRKPKPQNEIVYTTVFRINERSKEFDDPFQQVEYTYSLIESEVQA